MCLNRRRPQLGFVNERCGADIAFLAPGRGEWLRWMHSSRCCRHRDPLANGKCVAREEALLHSTCSSLYHIFQDPPRGNCRLFLQAPYPCGGASATPYDLQLLISATCLSMLHIYLVYREIERSRERETGPQVIHDQARRTRRNAMKQGGFYVRYRTQR